jgi:hypothetical protein
MEAASALYHAIRGMKIHQAYYTLTKPSGEEFKLDYKIQLTSIPSNLGRGEVLYFVCPTSGRRARILYRAYGSHYFKSRQAYRKEFIMPMPEICQKRLPPARKYYDI